MNRIVVFLLALSGPLLAQTALGGTPSAERMVEQDDEEAALKRKAEKLLREGNRLAKLGDFGAALPKFHAAYELYPSPKLLLNIGTSLRHTGRYAAAAESYEQYLADPAADPAMGPEIRAALSEIDELVGWIELRAGETGLRVSLDGRVLGALEREIRLRADPGPHTLVAEKPGREPAVRHVSVEAGTSAEVVLVMPDPSEPASEPVPVRPIVGYTVAGLGGAAIVVGAIVGGVALSSASEADARCAADGQFQGLCSAEYPDLARTARTESTASVITLAVGVALAIVGVAVGATGEDEGPFLEAGLRGTLPGPSAWDGVIRW